jgi:competence protein ComEA
MAGPALRLLRLPIDINLSSVEDLQALPGIGPGLASRLVAARPYRTISELRQVAGMGAKRVAALVGAAEITTSR